MYLVRIDGDSMQGAGIYWGYGDRRSKHRSGQWRYRYRRVEFGAFCKRLLLRENAVLLVSENPKYPARHVMEGDELVIWGVVKYSVRDHEQYVSLSSP